MYIGKVMKTEKLKNAEIVVPKKKAFIKTPDGEIGLHCCAVICGARGSGKSVAVSSKLQHLKKEGLADRIFLISPTAVSNSEMWNGLIEEEDIYTDMTNDSVLKVIEQVELEAKEWLEYEAQLELWKLWKRLLRSKRPIDEIEPDLLIKFMEHGILDMAELGNEPESKYGHKPVLHLVLDDCQSSQLFVPSTKNKLLNATIRHRHIGDGLGLSMWFLVQSYSTNSGLPKAIRDNSTILVLFPMKNGNNVMKIIEEVGGNIDEETFNKVYDYATKDDGHDFLVIEFSPKNKKYTFKKNWNTVLIPDAINAEK
jgi:hypothetical protein